MDMENIIGLFFGEVARRGVDHMVANSGHARVCSHCRNDDLSDFAFTLPCCARTLCAHCAARALVYRWDSRFVIVCDDCQTAHTVDATR